MIQLLMKQLLNQPGVLGFILGAVITWIIIGGFFPALVGGAVGWAALPWLLKSRHPKE